MTVQFTNKEKKIRKNWLIANFTLFITCVIPILCALLVYHSATQIIVLTLFCVFGVFIFWLKYHCAYKKNGTGYLFLSLIGMPYAYLKHIFPMLLQVDAFSIVFGLFCTVLWVWDFIVDIRLRKVNTNFSIKTSHPEYNDALHSLNKATCLDSLQSSYQLLLEKWPDLKEISLKKYERQKTIILEKNSSGSKYMKRNWIKGLDRITVLLVVPIALLGFSFTVKKYSEKKRVLLHLSVGKDEIPEFKTLPEGIWILNKKPNSKEAVVCKKEGLWKEKNYSAVNKAVKEGKVSIKELRVGNKNEVFYFLEPNKLKCYSVGILGSLGFALITILSVRLNTRVVPKTIK